MQVKVKWGEARTCMIHSLLKIICLGEYQRALEGYRRAMERAPELPVFYLIVASILSEKLQRPLEALAVLQQAVALQYAQVFLSSSCDF
jgi:hypothetical protein